MSFEQLGLIDYLIEKCIFAGYKKPTPVQRQSVPIVLSGKDLIACAQTGSGKTAAFILPIINKLIDRSNEPSPATVLILAPTRELAIQSEQVCRTFAPVKIRCAVIIGGAAIGPQAAQLKKRPHIIVATPGRLLDFIKKGDVSFKNLEILILDEADRMLDMGFLPDIKKIIHTLPKERQTLLFSATFSADIERIGRSILKNPETVQVAAQGRTSDSIKQFVYPVEHVHRIKLLMHLLDKKDFDRVLVFTRTKSEAERLSKVLNRHKYKANRIHGDRSQPQREHALNQFKNGQVPILIATDVASRGIDVDSVTHVVNYNVPPAPEDYVHRIGRTGRAGQQGTSITFMMRDDVQSIAQIEKLTGSQIERIVLPEYNVRDLAAEKRSAESRQAQADWEKNRPPRIKSSVSGVNENVSRSSNSSKTERTTKPHRQAANNKFVKSGSK